MTTRQLSDGTLIVDVRGSVDRYSTATLCDNLSAEVIAVKAPAVLVDLGSVTFMDDTALAALVKVQRIISTVGASLRVVNPSPCVAQLLHANGAEEALGCHPDGGQRVPLARTSVEATTTVEARATVEQV